MRRILAIAAASLLFVANASAGEDWTHELGIYGWLCSLEGTIGITNVADEPIAATFDDLLGYVDFAMAGHYEARGPRTVYVADIGYFNLGSERDAQVGNQPVTVETDLTQWIIEFSGGFRASPKVDILLAARYYDIDSGATFTSIADQPSGSVSLGWMDLYLGARYHTTFGERWFGSIRGDIGTGGSDFAWFGQIAFGYMISDHFGATAAWRILSLDYSGDEGSSYFQYDVTQSGLGLGLSYRF